jgi:CSLREA domain-containing protein
MRPGSPEPSNSLRILSAFFLSYLLIVMPFTQLTAAASRWDSGAICQRANGAATSSLFIYAAFIVTKVADTNDGTCDADCSLREAIIAANALAGPDTINFDITGAGPHTIPLDSVLPALSQSVNITNASGESITISGEGTGDPYRIFAISSGQTVTISNLTMTNGATTGAAFPDSIGGGILNEGTLTLTSCTVSNNRAAAFGGGGIYNLGATAVLNVTSSTVTGNHALGSSSGGGIYNNAGTVNVTNSTISGNDASSEGGGLKNDTGSMTVTNSTVSGNTANFGAGIINYNTLTLTNSTISGNNADSDGGGIYNNHSSGTVTLSSVTISNNRADNDNNGSGTGGGIYIFNTSLQPMLRNTIVAGNLNENGAVDAADDIVGTVNSTSASSFNLIGTGGAGGLTNGVNNNQVGVANPGLGGLTNNGGLTNTHALQAGSPAIDKGTAFSLTTDQRGLTRPVDDGSIANPGDGSDIGAFELGTNPVPTVTTTAGNLNYTENDPATAIDPGLTVTDADSTNLAGATVAITAGFVSAQDTLVFTNQLGITGNYNSGTGVLTLTGTTTVANYQTALRAVTYQNSSDNPTASRTVTFTASDGTNQGSATRGITISAADDAPVNTVPGPQATNQNTPLTFSSGTGNQISVADVDAGASLVLVQPQVTNGTLTLSGTSGLNFACPGCSGDGTADASMGFQGTLVNINAALNGMTFTPTLGFTGAATLTITSNDLGNTGSGGPLTDTDTVNIQVGINISIQDAQVAEPPSGSVNMVFTVTLSAPAPAGGAAVSFTTQDQAPALNHATAGQDYSTTSGTINFAAGEQFRTIQVPVLSDNKNNEANETFLVVLSSPLNATISNGTATGTILITNQAGALLISEVRTSGPAGAGDDFVEIYNNSDSPHTVNSISGGYGLFKMGGTCSDAPVLIGVIPNGTVIPARGHYLFTGSAYSLANYGGTGAAAGDFTLSADIENDHNVALFSTTSVPSLSTTNRFDAVGFGSNTGGTCDLFREGPTLAPTSGSTLEYSYFRKMCDFIAGVGCTTAGTSKDINDNAADFLFADTAGTVTPGGQRLGAPGPENLGSPRKSDPATQVLLLDSSVASSSAPNRVRNLTPGSPVTSSFGTMSIRRRIQNNTGAPVTRLRFRAVEMTTFSSSDGTADLRALTSVDAPNIVIINDSGTCGGPSSCLVTVKGLTLETPPTQSAGGGWNSTLSTSAITLANPLAPGASISVQFLLGVQQTGNFRYLIIVEALP